MKYSYKKIRQQFSSVNGRVWLQRFKRNHGLTFVSYFYIKKASFYAFLHSGFRRTLTAVPANAPEIAQAGRGGSVSVSNLRSFMIETAPLLHGVPAVMFVCQTYDLDFDNSERLCRLSGVL